jgi:hypothetical protein
MLIKYFVRIVKMFKKKLMFDITAMSLKTTEHGLFYVTELVKIISNT